ncbi:DUF6153 family protein [Streptomyces sp. NPDC015127]|uniref:DUF6153 family protein n=1 Tax=Streptomyces sp. NPDC015127 TaxID=3364939 RepID=UPI0036F7C5E8
MRWQPRRTTRPHGALAVALFVLAVLTGVVAMHGLGPAIAAAHPGTQAASPHAASPAAHPEPSCAAHAHAEDPRPADPDRAASSLAHHEHGASGASGGHVEHADGTCAASGIAAAPTLPALDRTVAAAAPAAAPPAADGPRHPRESRPPSLSTLQLLRI